MSTSVMLMLHQCAGASKLSINNILTKSRPICCIYTFRRRNHVGMFRRKESIGSLSWSKQRWGKYQLSCHSVTHFSSLDSAGGLSSPKSEDLQNSSREEHDVSSTSHHDSSNRPHIPVMVTEVMKALQPDNGQVIVDMTFGAGGHAKEILSSAPSVKYIASDRDPLAHALANRMAPQTDSQLIPVLSRFSELPTHLRALGITPGSVDGFLFDLGASSMQFDQAGRGFSLSKDGPLDMRMDGHRFPESPTAADVVNTLEPSDLAHIIKKYGEESRAREIAHAIVETRYAFGNFTRTQQLAEVIKSVFSSQAFRHDKMYRQTHVATKTFQALRIFVNNELNELHNGLEVARHFLKPGGRCVVISFHSLEDRIVKRHFHGIDVDQVANLTIHDHFRNANVSYDLDTIKHNYLNKAWHPLSRKVTEPTDSECYQNPRARSAKLRAAVREDNTVGDEGLA